LQRGSQQLPGLRHAGRHRNTPGPRSPTGRSAAAGRSPCVVSRGAVGAQSAAISAGGRHNLPNGDRRSDPRGGTADRFGGRRRSGWRTDRGPDQRCRDGGGEDFRDRSRQNRSGAAG
jgi:hypothetical protein